MANSSLVTVDTLRWLGILNDARIQSARNVKTNQQDEQGLISANGTLLTAWGSFYVGRRSRLRQTTDILNTLSFESIDRSWEVLAPVHFESKSRLNVTIGSTRLRLATMVYQAKLGSQCTTNAKHTHTRERAHETKRPRMRQIQTLAKQLQRHARHDAGRDGEHAAVHPFARAPVALPRELEPQRGDAGAQGLRQAAEDEGDEHGLEAVVDGEVEGQGHGEAFGDVVDEEGEEDGEAELGIGVVGGVGDEAFGELVQGDGDGGLQADGEEGVCGYVMVMVVGMMA